MFTEKLCEVKEAPSKMVSALLDLFESKHSHQVDSLRRDISALQSEKDSLTSFCPTQMIERTNQDYCQRITLAYKTLDEA